VKFTHLTPYSYIITTKSLSRFTMDKLVRCVKYGHGMDKLVVGRWVDEETKKE
jgi:uncharacterized protein YerC